MNRKINIEFIRVFAMFFTIVIHVSNVYVYSFGKISNANYLIAVLFNSMARICVPLFFMISGIVLLNEEYDKKKYFERIKKYVLILVIWSIIYAFVNKYINFDGSIFSVLFNSLFNANMTSRHLWFMYAIIGIYIALPFVQNMYKNLSVELKNLFLILWMGLSGLIVIIIPIARSITGLTINIDYPIPILNAAYYLGYFISGRILYEKYKDKKFDKRKNILCVGVYLISILIISLSTYFISVTVDKIFDSMMWYRSIFIIISAFAIFILIIVNEDKIKNKNILKLSKYSFGIYLIHVIFLKIIKDNFDLIDYNALIIIPIVSLMIYIISLVSSVILKKIPIINKILF